LDLRIELARNWGAFEDFDSLLVGPNALGLVDDLVLGWSWKS